MSVALSARNAIILGNMVGFSCVAASDIWSVFTGGARPVAKLFLVVHLAMAIAFILQWRARDRASVLSRTYS